MDTEKYKRLLLNLKKSLLEAQETGNQAEQTVELDQTRVGRLSRMDAMQAQAMSQASAGRREQMLAKIEAAIRRIDQGEYGACLRCDEPVHPERLKFDPTATLCIECARGAEA